MDHLISQQHHIRRLLSDSTSNNPQNRLSSPISSNEVSSPPTDHTGTSKIIPKNIKSKSKNNTQKITEHTQSSPDITSSNNIQSLLQQQKDTYVRELEDEQKRHILLTEDLTQLTSLLKESTELISRTVIEQSQVIR
jgi:hypothetical protein